MILILFLTVIPLINSNYYNNPYNNLNISKKDIINYRQDLLNKDLCLSKDLDINLDILEMMIEMNEINNLINL